MRFLLGKKFSLNNTTIAGDGMKNTLLTVASSAEKLRFRTSIARVLDLSLSSWGGTPETLSSLRCSGAAKAVFGFDSSEIQESELKNDTDSPGRLDEMESLHSSVVAFVVAKISRSFQLPASSDMLGYTKFFSSSKWVVHCS